MKKGRRKGPHRERRERKPASGMMLHQDASTHEWVGGEWWDLVVTMDDATGEVLSGFFVEEEGTWSSLRGVGETVEAKGLFDSLTDAAPRRTLDARDSSVGGGGGIYRGPTWRMPAETTGIVGGVDTHQDLHTAAIVTFEGAVLGPNRSPRHEPATGRCLPGSGLTASCCAWGSNPPAATAPASPGTWRCPARSRWRIQERHSTWSSQVRGVGETVEANRRRGSSTALIPGSDGRTKLSLKSLARRILDLDDEIAELDRFIAPLVEELAPICSSSKVWEPPVRASSWAGENPDRLEASFAMLCGACPLPGAVRPTPPSSRRKPPGQLRRAGCASANLRRAAHRGGAVQTRGCAA